MLKIPKRFQFIFYVYIAQLDRAPRDKVEVVGSNPTIGNVSHYYCENYLKASP